ncbi:protein of unknown function [Kingella kingae]|nr:protein of unknown function [Kingella kingae]
MEFGKLNTAQVERLNAMLSLNYRNGNLMCRLLFLHKQTVKKQPALCYLLN